MTLPLLSHTLQEQVNLPPDSKELSVPHFAALYRYLTHHLVDTTDGSSVALNKSIEDEGVEASLTERWIDEAKVGILIKILSEICCSGCVNGSSDSTPSVRKGDDQTPHKSGRLDSRTRELGYVMAEYLHHVLRRGGPQNMNTGSGSSGLDLHSELDLDHDQIEELMTEEREEFRNKIDEIAFAVGRYIIDLEKMVKDSLALVADNMIDTGIRDTSNIIHGGKGPSTIRSVKRSLPSSSSSLKQPRSTHHLSSASSEMNYSSSSILQKIQSIEKTNMTTVLPNNLTKATTTLSLLLRTLTTILTTQITHLETFTHSTQSRNLTTQAIFLNTVAKGMNLKAQLSNLQKEKEIYAIQGMTEALIDVHEDLATEEDSLARREKVLLGLLDEYIHAGNGGLDEMDDMNRTDRTDGRKMDNPTKKGEEIFQTLGSEYSRIENEIEIVRRDIEKLER